MEITVLMAVAEDWKSSNFGGKEGQCQGGVIFMEQGSDMTGITWTANLCQNEL